jgi:hypothetical protein
VILAGSFASAQSMGDAAQKERERREKLKQKGDRAALVTNDELKANKGSVANDPNAPAASPQAREAPPAATRPSPEPDRKAGEEEWRHKMALAHERITKAQEQYDYWKGQYLAPNDYFVDQDGKKIVGSVESLRKVIAEAKAELEKANAALAALEEQARRANVPPGWLR